MGNGMVKPEEIRNVAIVGHSHSGKTALSEAIMFTLGGTTRLGKPGDPTSVFDTEPEEHKRGGSIVTHFGWVEYAGKKINFLDTPGDQNFFWDGMTAMQGADAAVIVVSAVDGVRLQTRKAWAQAKERNLPCVLVINQMDRAAKKWSDIVREVGEALEAQLLPIQLPIGAGESFSGVVDLIGQKGYRWAADLTGKVTEGPVPADLKDEVEVNSAELTEGIVSTDDALLEKYLETNQADPEVVREVFFKAVAQGNLTPVLFTCASKNIGVQPILDLIARGVPSPLTRPPVVCQTKEGEETTVTPDPNGPFLGQVIHTAIDLNVGHVTVFRIFSGTPTKDGEVLNVATGEKMRLGTPYLVRGKDFSRVDSFVCGDIAAAIKLTRTHTNNTFCELKQVRVMPNPSYPKPMIGCILIPAAKKDEDKMKEAIDRLLEEDPTLSISVDDLSHRIVLSGLGHSHLDIAIERLNRKFKVTVTKELPPIPYRETLGGRVQMIEGKHKKQTGGAGQFGVCYIDAEPLPRTKGFEFVNDISGGAIPRQFIPSVEKGVIERAKHGMMAGYPLIDFRVTLRDGKYHPVDSKDIAFQQAGYKGLRAAMEKVGTKLLEPYYKMEIVVPQESSGAIMGDVSTRRGQVAGMTNRGNMTVVNAFCPLSEVQSYVADLQSMTAGQGSFTMEFDSYREVPGHLIEKIKAASPFLKQAAKEEEE
ncbi:MAG: elongation factor G [Pseudomonadota bacterium]